MRDTLEFPEEQPGTARAAGLRRLSRLTWRTAQLSAVAAVGFATLFARTGAAHTAGDSTAAAAKTSPPATLAPSSTAPAPAPSASSAPAPAPTVSSASHGGG